MNVSGLVGYSLLEHNNKNILILADVHDGVEYCKNESTSISNWLKNRKNNNQILLEEVNFKNLHLVDLWTNSKHTQELKKLSKEYEYEINSVDIRPLLLPFSWEMLGDNNKYHKILLREYLIHINEFFYNSGYVYNTIIIKEISKLNNNKYINKINLHYKIIKDIYIDFLKLNKHLLNETMINIYNYTKHYVNQNNLNTLNEINNIISLIMEWYIVLLALNTNENTIIHCGLAHTSKIVKTLEKIYKFNIIKQNGLNDINNIKDDTTIHNACIMITNDINNKFNKKYYFKFGFT
jgi:hypothetical protein